MSSLPETDKPLYFGLPANIDRSRQRTVSSQVKKTMLLLLLLVIIWLLVGC